MKLLGRTDIGIDDIAYIFDGTKIKKRFRIKINKRTNQRY